MKFASISILACAIFAMAATPALAKKHKSHSHNYARQSGYIYASNDGKHNLKSKAGVAKFWRDLDHGV